MKMRRMVLAFVLLMIPAAAKAQERGDAGVVMGLPAAFGFIWHASNRLAIRPELGVTYASTESESSIFGTDRSTDSWGVNVGASVPWYFRRFDNVRTYFSPRFAYSWRTSDFDDTFVRPTTDDTVGVTASFGAQFAPIRKFNVFGEVGYGFSRGTSKLETPIGTTKTTTNVWGVRSSVGVIFYFGRS